MKTMRDRMLKLMRGSSYQPMNKSELARALGIQSEERSMMRKILNKMERKGELVMGKKSRYRLRGKGAAETGHLVGKIHFHSKGHAWFYADAGDQQNIDAGLDLAKYSRVFIGGKDSGVALDGDKVTVRVEESIENADQRSQESFVKSGKAGNRGKGFKGGKKGGRWGDRSKNHKRGSKKPWENGPTGKVIQVIERTLNNVVGTYREKGKFQYVEPDFTGFPGSMELLAGDRGKSGGAKSGQRVVVELISWESKFSLPVGKIVDVLGWQDDPGVDIVSVIHKHGLRTEFSAEVLAEAGAISEQISKTEIERREDWRDELVLTVDPADAKDHDDAIIVKPLDAGGWELAVHIADVSHYVKPGSELDEEARKRGNSTYLVDRVLPMLPEKISNNVCSLRPGVERLTKCAVIRFDENGQRISARFCDAVIHSKAKMSYEEAQILLGADNLTKGDQVAVQRGLKDAWELASVLRKKRFADGALDLEFPEVKVLLDDRLKATGIAQVVHDESHQMVEECMLAANEAVAVELKMKRKAGVYRIHENPDFDKLEEFAETARALGYRVGDLSNKKHIQDLLEKVKGSVGEESIKIGLLKSLKRAAYSTEGLGHYGLAKMDYCHFTSPIRRYADLIVHRALQSLLGNPPAQPDRNPKVAVMAEIANHISETERKSGDAEMETKRMKMMEYLSSLVRGDKPVEFNAVVTDVRRMGLFVEITAMKVKGLVRVEDLPGREHGYWSMDGMRYASSDGSEVGLGQHVKVKIKKIDMERNMVDFVMTEI